MMGWIKKLDVWIKKLRIRLFLAYFIVFAFFFSAISLLLSGSIRNLLIDQIGSNRIATLQQIAERTDIIKNGGITLINLYDMDLEGMNIGDEGEAHLSQETIRYYLDNRKKTYTEVFERIGLKYDVVLIGENNIYYASSEMNDTAGWHFQPWYRHLLLDLKNQETEGIRFSRVFRVQTGSSYGYKFAIGKLIKFNGERAVLLVLIDESLIEDVYMTSQKQEGIIYIYDGEGFIVSHPNKKMLGKQFIDVDYMREHYGINKSSLIEKLGKSYMLSTYMDMETGWTIVEESLSRTVLGALNQTYWIIGYLLAAGIAFAIVVSMYMSNCIAKPLIRLGDAMECFGKHGDIKIERTAGTYEIERLQDSFNRMAVEISNLMKIVQEREKQKRELEVNFLRAQINPHFLYNMLFSIRCAVEVGKSEQAVQMLGAFIDLLRSTLSVKNSTVTLEDEFETTRKYLVVQKLRYGEKINYEFEVQDDAAKCMVPPLILQPLVENAIFHGIEAKKESGTVVIEAFLEGNNLIITVMDDGAGIDEKTLKRVRESCRKEIVKDTHSIGISNVHNRIRLNYGDTYGLTIDSEQEIGTTIRLIMPVILQEDEK